MRRWLNASMPAASRVADQSSLWLPGALAWMVTVGWIALVVGVARPPSDADLTFFGARIFTSGAWPWNGVALLVAAVLLVAGAIALASIAEAALLRGTATVDASLGAVLAIGAVCILPFLLACVAFGVALASIAPGEFNAPGATGNPLLRATMSLAPLVVAVLAAAVIGAAIHAAATRTLPAAGSTVRALAAAPSTLHRAGAAGVAQALALLVARVGFLVVAAVLLRVLWAPIDERLATEGIGIPAVLLLVGFVAIWLCLVLAGGALHAWGSLSWTRLLGAGREVDAAAQMESRSRP
jgi:hypothetical protein